MVMGVQKTLKLRRQDHIHANNGQQKGDLKTFHHLFKHLAHAGHPGGIAQRQAHFLDLGINVGNRVAERLVLGQIAGNRNLALPVLAVDLQPGRCREPY